MSDNPIESDNQPATRSHEHDYCRISRQLLHLQKISEKDAFPALEQLLLGAGTHLFDVFNSFSYVSPLCLRS
ncbi:MAG: hypothetical protein WAV96_03320, partial [Trichococcus flocculiformis]